MISARNKFEGKVAAITEGAVNGIVALDVNGETVKATISMEAIGTLGLEVGKEAAAFVKATEVMVGLGECKISARNQFEGKIISIKKGAVNAIVKIDAAVGGITATISNEAVEALSLAEGGTATAVIKATSVMIGC